MPEGVSLREITSRKSRVGADEHLFSGGGGREGRKVPRLVSLGITFATAISLKEPLCQVATLTP